MIVTWHAEPNTYISLGSSLHYYTHLSEHTNVYTFLKPFSIQFYDDFADEIWRPGFIYRQRLYQLDRASLDYVDELVRYKTDYIVIGPVSSDLQRATGQ